MEICTMNNYDIYAKLRDLAGVKDSEVARRAKIPPSTFTEWKNGRSAPKTDKMQKIANALNVPLAHLMGMDEIENAPVPKFEPEHLELVSLYSRLTQDEKDIILNTMKAFVAGRK